MIFKGNEFTVKCFRIGLVVFQLLWKVVREALGLRLPLFIGIPLFLVDSKDDILSTDIQSIVVYE